MNILVMNPGGNSLKAEIIVCQPQQQHAFAGTKLISVIIEGIGKSPKLSKYQGKKIVHTESIEAADYGDAVTSLFRWLEGLLPLEGPLTEDLPRLDEIDCVGIRVVHGGLHFTAPALVDAEVERRIVDLEKLAPLHNKSSVEILDPIRKKLGNKPIYAVFDTAFHRTIPDHASHYAIPLDLAGKHAIRRYGFHGISHRYMLGRYAELVHKPQEQCTLVTMHLESGCSVTAIRDGKSVDNTMGLTPLEGLMMGTRSGDIDPSVIPLLIREEHLELDEVMTLLNKKSGLLGVSGKSLDTRVLIKHYDTDPRVKLALDMFSYRVCKAVGGYLAALGGADAVIFGGGIAENTTLLRDRVGDSLRWCGLEVDAEANRTLIDIEGRLSTENSPLQAWVIPVEEGLQIAHECCGARLAEISPAS
ncbi:acetate kinase [Silvibacterium bohemicum]|uniref:Acetate kinase n=1 Tax=Silvibacterium bohemicum TaxID=1577686 RepID=A0A841JTV3_9BACT|nr:acetate/propionate family kinase [Silvibacterium bohemicum]MBB6143935.1 acetate kinase [Silvibacterium bohemicum]